MHTSETWLKQLVYRIAHRTLGTLLLLPTGTIYRGTPKQYSIVRVQKNSSAILFLPEKSGNVLPTGSAAFISMPEGRGLSPRVGKIGEEWQTRQDMHLRGTLPNKKERSDS
jgi:hypothetical protein